MLLVMRILCLDFYKNYITEYLRTIGKKYRYCAPLTLYFIVVF